MDDNQNSQSADSTSDDAIGGLRGSSNRADSGLTHTHDGRLEQMAVRRGWIKQRWPIDETVEQYRERVAASGQTLRDKILLATHRLVASQNERAQGIGIRSGMAMEAQNQADEHRAEALSPSQGPQGTEESVDQIVRDMAASVPPPPPPEQPHADGSVEDPQASS